TVAFPSQDASLADAGRDFNFETSSVDGSIGRDARNLEDARSAAECFFEGEGHADGKVFALASQQAISGSFRGGFQQVHRIDDDGAERGIKGCVVPPAIV